MGETHPLDFVICLLAGMLAYSCVSSAVHIRYPHPWHTTKNPAQTVMARGHDG